MLTADITVTGLFLQHLGACQCLSGIFSLPFANFSSLSLEGSNYNGVSRVGSIGTRASVSLPSSHLRQALLYYVLEAYGSAQI